MKYSREDSVGEEIENAEGGKHHPVGEPFCVILFVRGFDGSHRPVGGEDETNEIANELREVAEDHVQRHEAENA